ncbi:MAG: thioredoxin family protein [Deltaproteobacteria bacterium]
MTILRLALTLLLLASLAIVTPSCARDETATEQATPLERQEKDLPTKWLAFDDGLAKARTENKPIFVEFYAEWCIFCKKFEKETIKDQNVSKMLSENFVYARLNAEEAFGINAYPSLVFLDSKGKPITMLSGFIPPHQFMPVLAYIEQKCYETQISFRQFAQKGSCN